MLGTFTSAAGIPPQKVLKLDAGNPPSYTRSTAQKEPLKTE